MPKGVEIMRREVPQVFRMEQGSVIACRRFLPALLLLLLLFTLPSCVSVIRKDLMDQGIRGFSMAEVVKNPGLYEGKLFILGGRIVETKLTREGSLIEALYGPVNWAQEVDDLEKPTRRFLALYPKNGEILDPVIYGRGREVTIAAVFEGMRAGKIDDMEYQFPFFRAKQVYLWPRRAQIFYGPSPGLSPFWGPWRYGYYGPYYYYYPEP